jgi:hypothetical protein
MTKGLIRVILAIGAGLLAAAPAVRGDPVDALLARAGQFRLDDHSTRLVQRKSAVEGYRVCMEEGRDAVALKVIHDDQVTILEPGDCQLIVATKIRLGSAERLAAGTTLIGSFESPRKSREPKTNVSVARTAATE